MAFSESLLWFLQMFHHSRTDHAVKRSRAIRNITYAVPKKSAIGPFVGRLYMVHAKVFVYIEGNGLCW